MRTHTVVMQEGALAKTVLPVGPLDRIRVRVLRDLSVLPNVTPDGFCLACGQRVFIVRGTLYAAWTCRCEGDPEQPVSQPNRFAAALRAAWGAFWDCWRQG